MIRSAFNFESCIAMRKDCDATVTVGINFNDINQLAGFIKKLRFYTNIFPTDRTIVSECSNHSHS